MAKERNPVLVVVLTLVTFGIYGLYWTYEALSQVLEDKESSAALWFIGMLIPFVNLVVLWKFTNEVEEYSGGEQSGVLLFVLYLVFAPAAIYLVQEGLNAGLNS